MSTAIARIPDNINIPDTIQLCQHLAKSGYFADARDADKALVKVLAGREYGFSAIASLVGVHIIEGRPSLGANLIASMIKRSGKYDYRLIECTRERCEIDFIEGGKSIGPHIVLTMKEAVETKLAVDRNGGIKSNWAKHSDDMLFARCISKGFRRYCPDLAGGITIYSQDEIEADDSPTNHTTSEVIDTTYTVKESSAVASPATSEPTATVNSDFITKEVYQRELAPIMPQGYMAKLQPILGVSRWGEAPVAWLPLLKEIIQKIKEPLEFQSLYLGGKSLKECDVLKHGLALIQLQSLEGSKP